MSDKSNWKNKNRNILKNLPSWDKDANVIPELKALGGFRKIKKKTRAKGRK